MANGQRQKKSFNAIETAWLIPQTSHRSYSNIQAIRGTNWDVTVRFGELVSGEKIDDIGIEEVAAVTMSREQFADFARIVTQHLAKIQLADNDAPNESD